MLDCYFLTLRRTPESQPTATLLPYTTLLRSRVGGRLHDQNILVPKCSKIIVERRINGAVLPYLGQFADDTAVICERPAMDDVDHLVQPHGILGWAHIPVEGDERVGDRKRGVHGLILRLGDQFIEKRGSLGGWLRRM